MQRKILYPGSFDPPTYGHLDLIKRARALFDYVIVGVAENPPKNTLFSTKERVFMLKELLKDFNNVGVMPFSCLLVEFAKEVGANAILRGLRAISDFEYELALASINRKLYPQIETIFMMPSEVYLYISSSSSKEIVKYGGSAKNFIPPLVEKLLKEKFNEKK